MHMDDIFNSSMTEWFATVAPITVSFMSPYFDFLAFLIVLIMGGKFSSPPLLTTHKCILADINCNSY